MRIQSPSPTPAALGPDEYAAAKSRIGPPAQQMLELARWIVDSSAVLLAAPETLRAAALNQIEIVTGDTVGEQLRRTALSELKPLVDSRTRLAALENAGYQTVADVADKPAAQLTRLPGVGAHTAGQVCAAARSVADRLTSQTQIRFDTVMRPHLQTELLALLAALRHADATVAAVGPVLSDLAAHIVPTADAAARATSRFRMFFASRATKHATLSALRELETLLVDPEVLALQQTLTSTGPGLDPGAYLPDQLWRDFEHNAAAFYAILESLGVGRELDGEAARGFLGDDDARSVAETELDTSLLTATLRGYQKFGAQFALQRRYAILGDEMGLGKTVQALAAVAHLAAAGHRWFLVICPASVQVNWLNEIQRHTVLDAHSVHGRDRDEALFAWQRSGGVAVTTFGTVGGVSLPETIALSMLIVDEAHYVKNPETQRAWFVGRMIGQAERALFLTGTPMENRVSEFRNLVAYLRPDVADRVTAADALAGARKFRRTVAPVYLRRNQEDVLTELPERIDIEEWVYLSPGDTREYRDAVRSGNFMWMRRAAYSSSESAKLERLLEIVDEANEDGFKVLIFSYFLDVLERIGSALGSKVAGTITGSVPAPERQRLVDAFTAYQGPTVLLSQIQAGGVGLNIQAASIVILTEPQWKPSTEEQAIARAHRMGQVRAVQVHRLLAKDTVDDHMRQIVARKRELFDEYARKSASKEADARSVDVDVADDEQRIVEAERQRLGIK
ncbi:DEAD/DEAH box helicase [Hoyosella subflava]|nr:SNF2-related protein [Hoyosella subflava]